MNSPTNTKAVSQNKISFNSLAEMTAHHLEKSKDSSNKSNFAPKIFNKPFVIPKLSSKITNCQTNSTNNNKATDLIDHSERNSNECLSSVQTDSETEKTVNHKIKDLSNESHNCSELYKSCSDSSDTFNLEIDLTAALRHSKKMHKKANNHEHVQENMSTPVEMFNLDKIYEKIETLPSSVIEKSSNILECNLSMMSLRYKKLNHSNKVVSLFGKIICKKWTTHSRPYIKSYRSELNKNIKRFDFTSLSPDGIVLANLRRL
ncbi:uncharacterized protein [Chelonus insularis]|uniref:uncharacterized protein n=1 Tax=Chelonus insularis TaxID=460826 RepID=UPI00158F02E4|nr:uncharacterized protein LOC118071678 [Chelonus insularis]